MYGDISMQVHMASCLLVVVDSVEGAAPAHALALALVEAALHAFLTDLAAELLRFVNPAGDAEGDAFLEPQGVLGPVITISLILFLSIHGKWTQQFRTSLCISDTLVITGARTVLDSSVVYALSLGSCGVAQYSEPGLGNRAAIFLSLS